MAVPTARPLLHPQDGRKLAMRHTPSSHPERARQGWLDGLNCVGCPKA